MLVFVPGTEMTLGWIHYPLRPRSVQKGVPKRMLGKCAWKGGEGQQATPGPLLRVVARVLAATVAIVAGHCAVGGVVRGGYTTL